MWQIRWVLKPLVFLACLIPALHLTAGVLNATGAASNEYGFFANVNPDVDHPRWSQATERHIGASAFGPRKPTLPFNGYAAQVASLYSGMDLRKFF